MNKKEITEETYKEVRPKHAKVARAHGLPKVPKSFNGIPTFRPINDTIGSTHYNGKYITKILYPLTQNEYTLKDTFKAAHCINNIPADLKQDSEYMFISLDVVSLFTNMPLDRTVNIILDRIYKEKLIIPHCQKDRSKN